MKDNLTFGTNDVKEFYLVTYGLEKTLNELNGKNSFPFDDEEYAQHLEAMKEIIAAKFETFCRNRTCARHLFIKREVAAALRTEFYQKEKKEFERIKEYQESRPDLYD